MADIIVVHGTPGSGKSTHCERLTKFSYEGRPIYHISAGNRLRDIRTHSVESKFSDQINDPSAPLLLDHRIVNGIIFEYISECPIDSIILVDGYPRFKDAIDVFVEATNEGNHNLLGCINLSVSLDTSMNRLAGRGQRRGERISISNETVGKRFWEHETYTEKAIDSLRELTRIIDVDAEANVDTVWEAYSKAFRELVDKK